MVPDGEGARRLLVRCSLDLERDLLQLLPGIVVESVPDTLYIVGDTKAAGCDARHGDDARDGGSPAQQKTAAGEGFLMFRLDDGTGALTRQIDLEVGAGIDIDRQVVAGELHALGFASLGYVPGECFEHLLLRGTALLLD